MDHSKENLKPKTAEKHHKFWPPIPSILLVIGIYLISQAVASGLILLWPTAMDWSESRLDAWLETTVAQFWFIVLIEVTVLMLVFVLLRWRRSSFKTIGLKKLLPRDILYALSGFGLYFLLYLVVAIIATVISPGLNLEQEQQIGFETASTFTGLTMVFISLVILPPITEEILMRGFLYTGLRSKWPVWPAAIVTSLLFAVAHLQFGSGAPLLWVAAIDTFALSMVLVYLRERTGSLGAPILLHTLKNGIAFTLLFIIGIQ